VAEGESAACANGGVVFWNLEALRNKLAHREAWADRYDELLREFPKFAPKWWWSPLASCAPRMRTAARARDVMWFLRGSSDDEVTMNRFQIIFHEVVARDDGHNYGPGDISQSPRGETKVDPQSYINEKTGAIILPKLTCASGEPGVPYPATYYFSSAWNCRAGTSNHCRTSARTN
jgi:hypothetical protein